MKSSIIYILILCLFSGCSSKEEHHNGAAPGQIHHAEYIYRMHQEYVFLPDPPEWQSVDLYPWEIGKAGNYSKITKEFFRCKGSCLNPIKIVQKGPEVKRHLDCGGIDRHSLPLNADKEFIYPILIDLVNYIQMKTSKRVVITSGHRCPDHNTYVDPSPENRYSKHQIGGEVSFYVQGMENNPHAIVQIVKNYYLEIPDYKNQKEYEEFQRYEGETNVAELPWMNKEIFIKLFNKQEGRNYDNRHPYPYISLQVRYDREKGEKVIYSWERANRNYLHK